MLCKAFTPEAEKCNIHGCCIPKSHLQECFSEGSSRVFSRFYHLHHVRSAGHADI